MSCCCCSGSMEESEEGFEYQRQHACQAHARHPLQEHDVGLHGGQAFHEGFFGGQGVTARRKSSLVGGGKPFDDGVGVRMRVENHGIHGNILDHSVDLASFPIAGTNIALWRRGVDRPAPMLVSCHWRQPAPCGSVWKYPLWESAICSSSFIT